MYLSRNKLVDHIILLHVCWELQWDTSHRWVLLSEGAFWLGIALNPLWANCSLLFLILLMRLWESLVVQLVASTCNAGDPSSIPGLERSPGERNSYPLQYSGLENSKDCIVYGVAKSQTQLRDFHFTGHQTRCSWRFTKNYRYDKIFFRGGSKEQGNTLSQFLATLKTLPVWKNEKLE